jgi:soluble lytic murein transglycosylase-like protein
MIKEELMRYGRVKPIVTQFARNNGVSPQLIAGIIHIESEGDPNSIRYEPKFFKKYIDGQKLKGFTGKICSDATERHLRACSFGLMNVMGNTAREQGFKREYLTDLLDPEINLDQGCRYFKRLLDKYNDSVQALFHYNAGPGADYGGPTPNDYPSKVLAAIDMGLVSYLA